MKQLLRFLLRGSTRTVALTLALSVVAGVTSAGLVALVGRQFSRGDAISGRFVLVFLGLTVVAVVANLAAREMLIRLVNGKSDDLRQSLARRMVASDLAAVEAIGPDRMLATLVEDVRTVAVALNFAPVVAISLATIGSCIVFLGWFSLPGVAVLLAIGVAMMVPYLGLRARLSALIREMYTVRDHLYADLRSLTTGFKELKMDNPMRRRFFTERFEPTGNQFRESQDRVGTIAIRSEAWGQAFFFIFLILLLYVINLGWIESEVLGPFAVLALFLRTSMNQLTTAYPKLVDAANAFERIDSLELPDGQESVLAPAPATREQIEPPNTLVGRGLTFGYPENRDNFALGPIDFEVRSGEVLMITGGNGSGKTTLAKVIATLYPATEGRLELDGEPIGPDDVDWFRNQMSLVFAHPHFFRSLLPQSTEGQEHVRSLLQRFKLSHLVGEDGVVADSDKVSTGENKRLALMQAFLADRPIFLFDEWAANQDPSFKQIFYEDLLPQLKAEGKIVVVISHDEQYFHLGDRLLKLADGSAL